MRLWKWLLAGAMLVAPFGALAADSIVRFRLLPDPKNGDACRSLDPVLSRLHTITVKNADVELTSAGAIEGRMREIRSGVYRIAFELDGQRLDVEADLAPSVQTLSVTERARPCHWQAGAE